MDIIIREATSNDIPQILELYAELQPHDSGRLGEQFAERTTSPPINAETAFAVYTQAINSGVKYYVAVNDGKIVGSCYIAIIPNITRQCSPIGFIENVITASAYRRHGIGRRLMNATVEYAKKQGCYKVTLQSGIKRTEAHEFYKSVGFDGDSKKAFEIRFNKDGWGN